MEKAPITTRKPRGTPAEVCFRAILLRPASPTARPRSWTFLKLPPDASKQLPSRGMVTVRGMLDNVPIQVSLEPDGEGGHWLKVDRKLREKAKAQAGDEVTLRIAPVAPEDEPEPKVPPAFRAALAAAPAAAREVWSDITPVARRDWIFWMTSAKQQATRDRRIATACDMLAKGKRRACCFDRSGMFAKSLSCPIAENAPPAGKPRVK